MELTVYGPLRSATGEQTVQLAVGESETVGEVITAFLETYPRAETQLLDEQGNFRPSVRVMQDGESLDFDDGCDPDKELKLFPAMRGG